MIKIIYRKKIEINKLTEIPEGWTIKDITKNILRESKLWEHFPDEITGKKYKVTIEKEYGTLNEEKDEICK